MKYTIQENVQIVVALLKKYFIRHIVISPGGTNIPFVQAVQDDSFFKCYSVVDERSAMYFAIGLYLETGEVVATSCTSAQATRNYIPGLTEAFYKHVPIVAITTSKLERFQYQEYMQAPEQCSLPCDCVKKSFDLPPVVDDNTRMLCISRTRNALLELNHNVPGPIQLNLRIADNQQGKYLEIDLPEIEKVNRYMCWDKWDTENLDKAKILIVIGEHRVFSQKEQESLEAFCECYNAVVYSNHLSNFSGKYSIKGNLLLECGYISILDPDIVITIGGQTGDYPLFFALNSRKNFKHWRVSEGGEYVDTYGKLNKIFECPTEFFFNRLKQSKSICNHTYYQEWIHAQNRLDKTIELPFSNLWVAQNLSKRIPKNSIMNFAILNSLRCWNYFDLPSNVKCFSNVAAFGIDGCNSMLFGESVLTKELCFIVTGDLAFFYDMNVLGIRNINNNIRILLINNNGGAEFRYMTRNWIDKFDVDNFVAAMGHNGIAKGWSQDCNFEYLTAKTKEEFIENSKKFVGYNPKPIIFEVFTDSNIEVEALNLFLSHNSLHKNTAHIKKIIKKVIGQKKIELVKKIIR